MQEDITKEIDGISYTFTYLAPTKALLLSVTLVKSFLGPVGNLVSNLLSATHRSESILEMDLGAINISEACEKLSANLSPDQFLAISKDLLSTVAFAPGPLAAEKGRLELKLDQDFKGRHKHLLKVLGAALEVNYGDFFDDLAGLAGRAKNLISSLSPQASPGKSGE